MWLFCCQLLSCLFCGLDAKLVATAVIPHGDFAYDPGLLNNLTERAAAQRVHSASTKVGSLLKQVAPEVIFLTSPHGLELNNDFLLFENPLLSGSAPVGSDLGPEASTYDVAMSIHVDVNITQSLLARSRAAGRNVSGLQGFAGSQPLPISWGEVLPLSFLDGSGQTGPRHVTLDQRVVLLGIPYRRYKQDFNMVDELVDLGSDVGRFLEGLPERVAWVVSSDLAHTHRADGPYGFCPCAARFDAAVGSWAKSLSWAAMQEARREEQLGAASCGFTGLEMLHAALNATQEAKWTTSLLALEAPTYYGMAAAIMHPHSDSAVVLHV